MINETVKEKFLSGDFGKCFSEDLINRLDDEKNQWDAEQISANFKFECPEDEDGSEIVITITVQDKGFIEEEEEEDD